MNRIRKKGDLQMRCFEIQIVIYHQKEKRLSAQRIITNRSPEKIRQKQHSKMAEPTPSDSQKVILSVL